MKNVEFKVGDKVYFPQKNTEIWILEKNPSDNSDYPLAIIKDGCAHTIMSDGRMFIRSELPHIFHATQENKAFLEALYGVEFEKPPAKLTSIKIIQAMLARGDKCVCCWVDDYNENPTIDNTWGFIIDYDGSSLPFNDSNGSGWRYATPFDPKTGEVITELPE